MNFFQNITAEVTGWERNSYREALAVHAPRVIKQAYNRASAQTLGQVEIALESSQIDGPTDKKRSEMDRLRGMAKTVWEDDLLSSLIR